MLPTIGAAVREAGLCLGLGPGPANDLQAVCEALIRLITRANLGEGRIPQFEVEVFGRNGNVVVRIDDQGSLTSSLTSNITATTMPGTGRQSV